MRAPEHSQGLEGGIERWTKPGAWFDPSASVRGQLSKGDGDSGSLMGVRRLAYSPTPHATNTPADDEATCSNPARFEGSPAR